MPLSNEIRVPSSLLNAVASRAHRITLIVGAGCSLEEPTGLKLSCEYSRSIHDDLVADEILCVGECTDPEDLSALASLVYAKTCSQADVVKRLPLNKFKYAKANEGYRLAVALLREGSIGVVATLNYDLALTDAVRQLDGIDIDEIAGPEDLQRLGRRAIIYLHRNANESDFEKWILRKEALNTEWQGGWEAFVAGWLTASPVVLFAGLGSPAAVLTETLRKIRSAFPGQIETFLADPSDQSPFVESLDLAPGNHIQASWGAFMGRLAERVVVSLRQDLMRSCSELCLENGWTDPKEGIAAVCEAFLADGLPTIGQRRAVLLCSAKAYEPDCESTRLLVADLILAVSLVAVTTSAEVTFNSRGDAILRLRDDRTATIVLRSGSGYKRWEQLEGLLANRGGDRPNLVVAGGFSQGAPNDVAPPVDIVDNEPTDDVAFGCEKLRIVTIDDLRSDLQNIVRELA